MSKAIEFYSFSELPWQISVGGTIGMAIGSCCCTYLEWSDQRVEWSDQRDITWIRNQSVFTDYWKLFAAASAGGMVGALVGPMVTILWPITCWAAAVSSVGLGAKYLQIKQ